MQDVGIASKLARYTGNMVSKSNSLLYSFAEMYLPIFHKKIILSIF